MKELHLILFTFLFFISCNEQKKTGNKEPFTNISACVFSQIAYCHEPQQQLNKFFPKWKVVWNAEALNGNHAFAATNGEKYAIAIRGSLMEFSLDALENWIYQDINIVSQEKWNFTNSTGAKISTGAYRGWKNLIAMKDKTSGKDILSFIQENINEKTPVIFTGHSLGGNLATVLASYISFKLKESGHPNDSISIITFAAPAAGNSAFANDFNKKFPTSVRVENTGDIVPKFPCTPGMSALEKLYPSSPEAAKIYIGYQNSTTSLSNVFKGLSIVIAGFELANGFSHFTQTNGEGTQINIKLSGKNNSNDISSWLAEAGYQHGIAQYAAALNAPIVDCDLP